MVSASGLSVNGRGAVTNIEPIPDSVIRQPHPGEYGFGDYILYMAGVADSIPQWGTSPAARDRELRSFWHNEPILASAIFTMASRYCAFEWELEGPDRMVYLYSQMLHSAQQGKGWNKLMMPVVIDYFTQDNGAFIEIIRASDDPLAPVVTLNHLDSARCTRTGILDEPVIYYDRWGLWHKLKWYQVIEITEMASPVEQMRGMQICAVSRLLRAAQTMRDVSIHNHEKLSGRFTKAIHLVSGVQTATINDAIAKHQAEADNRGLLRYNTPVVIGSLDPTASVSSATIELASLPDSYNAMDSLREYLTILALAFGTDYQEFAPLMTRSGGAGGGGTAADTGHLKARGKGPSLFRQNLEYAFNYHGVFPKNIVFSFSGQDTGEDLDNTKLALLRAEERAQRIKSGELTPEIAVKMAVDAGDLDPKFTDELLAALAQKAADEKQAAADQLDLQKTKLETSRDGALKTTQRPQMGKDGD